MKIGHLRGILGIEEEVPVSVGVPELPGRPVTPGVPVEGETQPGIKPVLIHPRFHRTPPGVVQDPGLHLALDLHRAQGGDGPQGGRNRLDEPEVLVPHPPELLGLPGQGHGLDQDLIGANPHHRGPGVNKAGAPRNVIPTPETSRQDQDKKQGRQNDRRGTKSQPENRHRDPRKSFTLMTRSSSRDA